MSVEDKEATVRRLAADGRQVVAADLGTAANRKSAEVLPAGVQAHWADLTAPADVDRLVAEVAPAAVIHLAAIIPPAIYRNAALARRVNVDATATLVRTPASVTRPGVAATSSSWRAVTWTSSRVRHTWFGPAPSTPSKTSRP